MAQNKIWLIVQREYISRVRKKTFILSTILTPLLFAGVIAAVVLITVKNIRNERVAVVDPGGVFKSSLESSDLVRYDFNEQADTSNFVARGYSALLYPPNIGTNQTGQFQLITEKSLSRFANERIKRDISRALENNMISQELKVDPKRIDSIRKAASETRVEPVKKSDLGRGIRNNFDIASMVGYVTGFLIYITLFIYGVMVMRGVMEEKTSRIAEVIVSSVRPFQLMMGKIIGIGAVGLTQFIIWILLLGIFTGVLTAFLPADMISQAGRSGGAMPGAGAETSEAMMAIARTTTDLSAVNWPVVIGCFIFYFIGGYLFYASLFAAVGSAVNEDAQDAQSLTFPITVPIILAIIIMVNSINDPASPLAIWSSIIPFFSPIVMMSRIPFGVPDTVPYWQLGTSMALLVLGFLFTTWLSAKIYRTGILMYGKKPAWKEMMRWLTQRS